MPTHVITPCSEQLSKLKYYSSAPVNHDDHRNSQANMLILMFVIIVDTINLIELNVNKV